MTPSLGTRASRRAARQADAAVAEEIGLTVHDVASDLRRDVAAVRLPLPVAGAADAEASRDRLLAQLDEHLLPRMAELSSPAVVVVAGSTGAGKSTLYNSLLGEEVSQAGVLRPTTREPVLSVHPLDADLLSAGPLVELSRVVQHEAVPRGTALLDAPDLDSFVQENRSTAQQLLEGADLWLFVTTAARYGDALPWQALARATERGASVAMVLNRVPKETLTTVRGDLLQRLREHGMTDVPLFVVPDVGPHEGMLEPAVVAPVRRWLSLLAGPDRSRAVIVRTLKGALGALPGWVTSLADAVDRQRDAADTLRRTVEGEIPAARRLARDAVGAGVVAGASVEARWRELSGAVGVDRVKVRGDRARSTRRAGRARSEALDGLRGDVVAAAARTLVASGARVEERLRGVLAGPGAPEGGESVAPDGTARSAAREESVPPVVEEWADGADALVATAAAKDGDAPPQDAARLAAAVKAYGQHGLATLLLAAAAGSDDAARVLTRVLGTLADGPVATLREDLADRAAGVVDAEVQAVLDELGSTDLVDDAAAGLRVRLAELRRLT
ncbi:50S ribosome-binding GTPase [Isoptericola sp. NEAU-Y5]|uniref:50S ribosome-binding GTPase n=1 Tax=Isoptericola luteus TaxID=2879484 RepID=A0ABS7ZEA4_9MICO|nr:GTPase domain-containing protein [Isoptericola sp. NEAU-Y5]MCA5893355.1 50S ribosome-binding GTPase [Isoptericola sp. NEAU-Y5]